jgi:hypothetical protein
MGGIEALREPTIHRRKQLARFGPPACSPHGRIRLVAAQFEGLCLPLARTLKHLLERGLSVLRTPCTTSRNLSTSDDVATTTADLHETRRNGRRGGRQAGERHIAAAAACPSGSGSSTAAITSGLR